MAISRDPLFVPGIWGPYFSAMVPGFWLNEGGQSATGKLIDHLIQSHPAAETLKSVAKKENCHQHDVLNSVLRAMAGDKGGDVDLLTKVGTRHLRTRAHIKCIPQQNKTKLGQAK